MSEIPVWEIPEVKELGAERIAVIKRAAQACQGKSGMERLDLFLVFGEELSKGEALTKEEGRILLAAVAATMEAGERKELEKMMGMFGV